MYNLRHKIVYVNTSESMITVQFDTEGLPPVFKNMVVLPFEKSIILQRIEELTPEVTSLWDKIKNSSNENEITDMIDVIVDKVYKPTVTGEQPVYDSNLSKLTVSEEETETSIEKKYNITPLSAEEIFERLNERREVIRGHLKGDRDSEIESPINDIQVASVEDRENIREAILRLDGAASDNSTVRWVLFDNTTREVTVEELQEVINSYIERKSKAFMKYTALLEQLSMSNDPETFVWS